MKKQRIFVFDIDGTLINPKTHKIPDSAFQAMDELKTAGHIIGLATGRNYPEITKVLDMKKFDFAITCNGGHVQVKGKQVFNDSFSLEEKHKVIAEMEKHNLEYGVMAFEDIYALNPDSKKVKQVIDFFDIALPQKKMNFDELAVYQFNIFEAVDTIPLLSLDKRFVIHSYGHFGYDIALTHITKGSALRKLFSYLAYDLNDCIAFGDADNDITFLKTAGIGIAMGNASEQAKANADFVTKPVWDDGIFHALKHYRLIK